MLATEREINKRTMDVGKHPKHVKKYAPAYGGRLLTKGLNRTFKVHTSMSLEDEN
jgi:hypothetical protein